MALVRLRPNSDRLVLGTRPTRKRRPLTARQREVLSLFACGATTKEVAAVLEISATVAGNHAVQAEARLRAVDRDHAIAIAIATGEIDAPPEHISRLLEPLFAELDALRGSDGQRFFPTSAARVDLSKALLRG